MKITPYIYVLMYALLVISGCRQEPVTPTAEVTFEIHPERMTCGPEEHEDIVNIESDTDWEVGSHPDWIGVLRNGESQACIYVARNDGADRTGKITFKAGDISRELTVEQSRSDIFDVSHKEIRIGYEGDSLAIKVNCYSDWRAVCNDGWIDMTPDRGSAPQDATVCISLNEGREERIGQISFIRETDTIRTSVYQEGFPFIELAKEEIETDGDGGTFDVLFMTNTTVKTECLQDWIRVIRQGANNMLSFEVDRNLSDEPREGKVMLRSESYDRISVSLTVRQGEKIPHPKLEILEGSHITVTSAAGFTLHPVFEDMTDTSVEWTSSSPGVASVDRYGHVEIHESGTTVIHATNRFHGVEASITIDVRITAEQIRIFLGNQDMIEVPVSYRMVGEKLPVRIEATPAGAFINDFIFFSSNPETADFKDNILHCMSVGKTQIYVESQHNAIRYEFKVVVNQ